MFKKNWLFWSNCYIFVINIFLVSPHLPFALDSLLRVHVAGWTLEQSCRVCTRCYSCYCIARSYPLLVQRGWDGSSLPCSDAKWAVFQIVELPRYAQYFTHIVKWHLLALKYGSTLSKSWSAAIFFLTSCSLKTILRNLNTSHSLVLERIHFYGMIHAASTLFFLTFFKKKN